MLDDDFIARPFHAFAGVPASSILILRIVQKLTSVVVNTSPEYPFGIISFVNLLPPCIVLKELVIVKPEKPDERV